MRRLRIGMAQMNATVGDFDGNVRKILNAIDQARSRGVDLLTFPELAICGYPPEDLIFKPQFTRQNRHSLSQVIGASSGITLILGFVDADEDVYNAAAVVHDGKLAGTYRKIYLPNYGVFDENRYFKPGNECPVYTIFGVNIGVNICEDIWFEFGPPAVQAYSGAEVIINISASPYHFGKGLVREEMLAKRAVENKAIVAYNNLVGGQDELVFDGSSIIMDEKGRLVTRGEQFKEDLIVADLDIDAVVAERCGFIQSKTATLLKKSVWHVVKSVISEELSAGPKAPLPTGKIEVRGLPGEIYDALVLGTHDYVIKNGFKGVVIGLSGGIDSSLVAAIAVDALGGDNVAGVIMPSRYSSTASASDAGILARNLGVKLLNIPIEKAFQAYLEMLAGAFQGTEPGVAEENIQARIRGNILMALSNKFGWLVLTTGNKSEMATGYTTLYGDMAGGFAVIKDVPKTMVYQLAEYRNFKAGYDLIPAAIIGKAPSAELRPEQKDADSLPVYEVLDPVLAAYVEEDKSIEQIIAAGFDEAVVKRAANLVDGSEYKRRQAPPGVKITTKAFGRDRRLPITNRFKEW